MRRLLSLSRYDTFSWQHDEDGTYFTTLLKERVDDAEPRFVVIDPEDVEDVARLERVRQHYALNFEVEVLDPDNDGHVELRYYTPHVDKVAFLAATAVEGAPVEEAVV